MRLLFIIVSVLTLLSSCGSSDTNKNSTAPESDNHETTEPYPAPRLKLIQALKDLHIALASKDHEKIASYFTFPIADTTFWVYLTDSNFNNQYTQNGNRLTRPMFDSYFSQIYQNTGMSEVLELFKNINVDSLHFKDSLTREIRVKTEVCYSYYGLTVHQDLITLTVGKNSNDQYQDPDPKTDTEAELYTSEVCEHTFWWIFRWDGKELRFVQMNGAG